jgi:hypothetical protein
MRGRKLLVAVVAVLVAAGTVLLWPRTDRITEENCERIQLGMGRAEVEALLGGPPGDYRTFRTVSCGEPDNPNELGYLEPDDHASDRYQRGDFDPGILGRWFGNDGYIRVEFTPEVVFYKDFIRTRQKDQTFLDNFVWRAKRQWRRWFPE